MLRLVVIAAVAASVGACAKSADKVTASYVSPYQYENLSCPQLADEAGRLSQRAAQAAGVQDDKANKDAVLTGVALVIFWPAAFFVGGDSQSAAELGRLKGEMDAIEQVSIRKRCGIRFQRAAPPPEPTPQSGDRLG